MEKNLRRDCFQIYVWVGEGGVQKQKKKKIHLEYKAIAMEDESFSLAQKVEF